MNPRRFLVAVLPLLVVACGGSDGSEGGGGGAGGSSQSAGGSGGSSAGASSGAGSAGSAGAATNAKPMGTVQSCFGPKCAIAECDNHKFWADIACSDVYDGPVGDQTNFCAPDGSGSYCLDVTASGSTGFGDHFAINCAAGVASIVKCKSGCGYVGNQPVQCN